MAKKDLQGTLDLLVLKTLDQKGEMYGYGIVLHVQRASDELLAVEEGSLYPALHRMELSGWIKSAWALTESGRNAKYYKLTAAADWPGGHLDPGTARPGDRSGAAAAGRLSRQR
jgi:transcriptional regulator